MHFNTFYSLTYDTHKHPKWAVGLKFHWLARGEFLKLTHKPVKIETFFINEAKAYQDNVFYA